MLQRARDQPPRIPPPRLPSRSATSGRRSRTISGRGDLKPNPSGVEPLRESRPRSSPTILILSTWAQDLHHSDRPRVTIAEGGAEVRHVFAAGRQPEAFNRALGSFLGSLGSRPLRAR